MARAAAGAGPWGRPALAAVRTALGKGWPAGLTVLTGDDLYHLDLAQELILDHLAPDRATTLSLSIVGDTPITTAALAGAARVSGMFASRRVVFLRDVSALEGEPEPLIAYAAQPAADSYVVVRAPKLDRKRKLGKALAESGNCLTFRTPASTSELTGLASEMTEMAAERGLTLDEKAAGLILDLCGPDLHRIAGELDKLSLWRGSGATGRLRIDAATVRTLVSGSGLMSGWELADAVTERKPEEATAAARRLLDAGDEPIKIVGGLASRVRTLLKAKAMTEAGASAKAVVDASRAWYFRDALAAGLARYSMAELLAMPGRLLEADRSFKSRSIDKGAVLEALVSRLTAKPRETR